MLGRLKFELIFETVEFPVHYDSDLQKVFDKNNNQVLDVRGWGRIQYMSDPETRQDQIGLFIAESMNTKYTHWKGVQFAKEKEV